MIKKLIVIPEYSNARKYEMFDYPEGDYINIKVLETPVNKSELLLT